MSTKFTNNASSKLTQALTADATSMHIQAEDVSKFPVLGAKDFCRLTIVGDHGDHEIVKVTSISSDGTCTIERAQESTTAKEWPIENKVELRITAEYLNSITTSEDVLSLVSPIEEDISNINNNITNLESKHNSDITTVQENIENNISVSISNLEQSIADTNSSLESSINSVKEEAEASYVKKIGDTMTGSLNIKASNPIIAESNTSITKGTTPAENVTSQIKYTDKDGKLTGAVLNSYLTDGSIKSALLAVDPSSDNTSEISINYLDGAACGYAPSPAIDATSSEITTASWVNSKLTNYLPKTGGDVNGTLVFKPSSGIYNDGIEKGSIPSQIIYTNFQILDKNKKSSSSNRLGLIETSVDTTGRTVTSLQAYRFLKGSTDHATLQIVCNADGTGYATAPSPSDNANGTEIATTYWANKNIGNKLANYLPLTGGIMTGELPTIRKNDNTGGLIIRGGTDLEHGANIYLYGNDYASDGGWAQIITKNSSGTSYALIMKPNGFLSWGGKSIVRSVNNRSADSNGNVTLPFTNIGTTHTSFGNNPGNIVAPYNGLLTCILKDGGNGEVFTFYRNGTAWLTPTNPDQGWGTLAMPFAFPVSKGETYSIKSNRWIQVRIFQLN